MSWFLTNLISAFLLPPFNLLVIGAVGLWLWNKRPLVARWLVTTSIVLLWLLSTPYLAEALLHSLEGESVAADIRKPQADAIVVLGGGSYFRAPEYGGKDTVSEATLVRLRYAVELHRETGKPILVTGGTPLGSSSSEAEQMKHVLEQEFNVPVRWVEGASDNTWENARLSRQILQPEGIERIYLVTHAWHMPRALYAFRAAGFQATPAATAYTTRYQTDLAAFIPSADALRDSRIFVHELIGMFWYRLKSKL
jgi:uncharacterized SAM-binding protein YcdF (DUF218 family)